MIMRKSRDDRTFDIVNAVLLTVVMLVILYPLFFVLIASVSDPLEVLSGNVLLMPKGLNGNGYRMVFRDPDILVGYRNTIFYTVAGTLLNLALTVLAAYPLSRKDFVGRKLFTVVLTITLFFSGGLIPTYLMMTNTLHITDTVWSMLLPGAVSVWNIIIVRTYIQTTIPAELQEAATVDGCTNMQLLCRIILPLSKPVLAVMALFYGVGHWNEFFNALVYLNSKGLYPLQLILRSILIQNQMSDNMLSDLDSLANRQVLAESIKYALIVVSSAPVIIIYPFLQKYFVKGLMVGAIKG